MSRDSAVTFEQVSKACFELLGRGERPARQSVQELLATDRYLGRKGSTDLVNKYINDFWASMAKTFQMPNRVVAGVPEAFVPIIDKALVEMVAVARQMATAELTEREDALDKRAKEMEASLQEARDSALAADQLRVRAEGELSAVQARATELKASLTEAERKLADETRKVEAHQRTIGEKDAELARQFAALEAAAEKLELANEAHRMEANRLMKQVDDERQAARRESQALRQQIETARSETDTVRRELSAQREENARIKAEAVAKNATIAAQATTIEGLKGKLAEAENAATKAQRDATILQVKFDTAEGLRKEAEGKCSRQAEEIGELRQAVAALENEKKELGNQAEKPH